MPISDLTGTTWVLNTPYTGSIASTITSYNVNYTYFSPQYNHIENADYIVIPPSSNGSSPLWLNTDGELSGAIYNPDQDTPIGWNDRYLSEETWCNYSGSGGNSQVWDATITFDSVDAGADATNSTLISWLEAHATQQSSQLSVDLSTLSGWSNVSSGSHTLKVKAKATGYQDSALSAGASFVKGGTTYTVNLRADDGYGAVPGHAPDGYVKYRVNGSTVGMITTYGVSTTLTGVGQLEINCNYNGGFINELRAPDESFITDLSYDGDVWVDVSEYLATIAAESYVVIYCEG